MSITESIRYMEQIILSYDTTFITNYISDLFVQNIKPFSNFFILMKLYFVIKVLALHYTYARLSLEETKKIEKSIIISAENKHLFINPEGPLNLLRGYLYFVSGFMLTKELYLPEMNIYYNSKSTSIKARTNTYSYTRTLQNEENKYATDYQNALTRMFSVDTTQLSSEAVYSSVFTNFLREKQVKDQKHYILAALLLLSEGVNVHLEWKENDRLTKLLLKKVSEENLFFDIAVENKIESKDCKVAEIDAKKVIDFFNVYKNKKSIAESLTMKEFKKRDFLKSSQFLIQAYIFEFIKTIKDAENFIKAVYEILSDIVIAKEKSATDVFNKCFVSVNSTKIVCSDAFQKINAILNCKAFRHSIKEELKATDLKNEKIIHSDNALKQFFTYERSSSFVKTLFKLFFSLLYNPTTKRWSTEKLGEGTHLLKQFFIKHSFNGEKSIIKTYKDWYKLLVEVKNENAAYLRSMHFQQTVDYKSS